MAYTVTADLYVDIDDVPLDTPAWATVNPLEVWKPAGRRGGEGIVIPGADGRRPIRSRIDETPRVIALEVFNHLDWEGTAWGDLRSGFLNNVAHLVDNIVADPGGDGTRLLTLHLGDDGDWVADVVVMGLDFNEETGSATIDLRIPAGQLARSGS